MPQGVPGAAQFEAGVVVRAHLEAVGQYSSEGLASVSRCQVDLRTQLGALLRVDQVTREIANLFKLSDLWMVRKPLLQGVTG